MHEVSYCVACCFMGGSTWSGVVCRFKRLSSFVRRHLRVPVWLLLSQLAHSRPCLWWLLALRLLNLPRLDFLRLAHPPARSPSFPGSLSSTLPCVCPLRPGSFSSGTVSRPSGVEMHLVPFIRENGDFCPPPPIRRVFNDLACGEVANVDGIVWVVVDFSKYDAFGPPEHRLVLGLRTAHIPVVRKGGRLTKMGRLPCHSSNGKTPRSSEGVSHRFNMSQAYLIA